MTGTMTSRARVGQLQRVQARAANAEIVVELDRLRASGLAWHEVAAAMNGHERPDLRKTRYGAEWNLKNAFATWRRGTSD
ncbi:hypothetical protein [Deinococcus navajonensis]|uniref:Uncharacterized protein n=1 Tax=Deinococcus navajonensis TaxID=309884 RepID=A0ABV8XSZ9_9DEIO